MNGLQIGSNFQDRYRIIGELGRGAFGVVYEAQELESARKVAIKLVAAHILANPLLSRRFERELQLIGRLRDPHTVRLLNYGRTEAGDGFLVLEHVPGRDLSELIRDEAPLPSAVVAHITRQVLQALVEAHGAGIVHRDIKPENIRIYEYGGDAYAVKLLDFGVAKSSNPSEQTLTQTGAVVGTMRYMAPEQMRAEAATPVSDLYSLGLVMLEMLGGRNVLSDVPAEQLRRLDAEHPLPSVQGAPELEQVIGRLCAFEPRARLPSAQAAQLMLDRALVSAEKADIPREPHRSGIQLAQEPPAAVSAPTVSNRALIGLSALLGLLCVILVVVIVLPSDNTPKPAAAPTVPKGLTQPRPTATPTTPDGVGQEAQPFAAHGCGRERPELGRQARSEMVGLTTYRWMRYVPSSYDRGSPQPFVVVLPPYHIPADEFQRVSGFEEAAEKFGIVLITVDMDSEEAVAFELFANAVAAEQESLCLDPERSFIAGHGTGGHRALKLACDSKIAGVMVSSARPSTQFRCTEPQAAILLSPLHSPREPVNGGRECERSQSDKRSLGDYRSAWQRRNGCSEETRTIFDERGHTCVDYACAEAPFRHCTLKGGHPWPGTKGPVPLVGEDCDGPPTIGFPAADIAMQLFASISEQKGLDVPSSPPKKSK